MSEKATAIIELGGKQHLVTAGDRVSVNRLSAAEGDRVTAKNQLDGATVELKVTALSFGPKINGLKFKNKIRYLKRYGHRQPLTLLEVVSIGGKVAETEKASTPKVETKQVVDSTAKPKKTISAKKAPSPKSEKKVGKTKKETK